MFRSLNKKAQSTAEYVIVLGLIVAAVMAMQTYVKRGLQGRIRDAVDFVGSSANTTAGVVNFTGDQYEPYYLSTDFNTSRTSKEVIDMAAGMQGAQNTSSSEFSNRTGNHTIGSY